MKNKKQILYSLADWKFHNNKLGYDDLVDEKNNLVVVVSVMDIALGEILNSSFLEEKADQPKKLYVLGKDNIWSVYLDVKWLTPTNVQQVLNEFGQLVNKKFIFKPYILPNDLKIKLDKKVAQWANETKETLSPASIKKSEEFLAKLKKEGKKYKNKTVKKIPDKRLIEIINHKMKF